MHAQLIQAAYFSCIAVGLDPTSRNVDEMVRRIRGGPGIRRADIVAWLREKGNGNHLGTKGDAYAKPERNQEPRSKTPPREPDVTPTDLPTGTLHARTVKESSVMSNGYAGNSLREFLKPSRARKNRETEPSLIDVPKTEPTIPAWSLALCDRIERLLESPRTIGSLTTDERFDLARFHAVAFGHCRVDETKNRSKAGAVAKSLAQMASSRDLAHLTVANYLAAAKRTWEARGCGPWFTPWEIVAMLDAGSTAPAQRGENVIDFRPRSGRVDVQQMSDRQFEQHLAEQQRNAPAGPDSWPRKPDGSPDVSKMNDRQFERYLATGGRRAHG